MKREFLMLAHTFKKQDVIGWYMSTKLDGMRCWWDGGVTRGLPVEQVPWANHEKDPQQRHSTGLWTRYMKPIQAPGEWLDKLPPFSLDGELWSANGQWDYVVSTCKKLIPDVAAWRKILFMIFDSPAMEIVTGPGLIDNPVATKVIEPHNFRPPETIARAGMFFKNVYVALTEDSRIKAPAVVLEQEPIESMEQLQDRLNHVIDHGGEGLMLRDPHGTWVPQRSKRLLKYKPHKDAEGTVVGYVTALPGKLQGLMGALVLSFNGKTFKLSGFTDAERRTTDTKWVANHPSSENTEVLMPDDISVPAFPRGTRVTFKYRELSPEGIPKEARYWRKRHDSE